ncbi:hypothetical protein GEM_5077 [Burkholderia cepacia GG4]|uniref:Uncharacterized protein n=1 Tax=Burkholderia cepacia GG4 TaxID=1009846 RepID=A0A9W3K688_BURCE|nr:hypothetical protein GEM_5077 [Burkholderia cepacia GG4]
MPVARDIAAWRAFYPGRTGRQGKPPGGRSWQTQRAARRPPARHYAVSAAFSPQASIICWRITNFCTLPVTVIGSSSTKHTYFGIL